jgi:hypothetical protein
LIPPLSEPTSSRLVEKGDQDQALGLSRGGLSTKIHLAADAKGQPIRFILTGGQAHDASQAIPLLTDIKAQQVMADNKGMTATRY